jgi:hypothetical protein
MAGGHRQPGPAGGDRPGLPAALEPAAGWATVLVPLAYTDRRWRSPWPAAAIVAAEIVISLVQSAPDAVIVRRVLL